MPLPGDPGRSRLSRWEEWERREPIALEERQRFHALVQEERQRARAELGLALDTPLSRAQRAKVDRKAIRRALVAHGVLVINEGVFLYGIRPRFLDNNSGWYS